MLRVVLAVVVSQEDNICRSLAISKTQRTGFRAGAK